MDLDRLVFDICGVNITDDDGGDDANGRGGIYGEFLPIFLSVSSTFIFVHDDSRRGNNTTIIIIVVIVFIVGIIIDNVGSISSIVTLRR